MRLCRPAAPASARILASLLLAACAAPESPPPAPEPEPPGTVHIPAPLAWEDGTPEKAAWSAALRDAIRPRLASFEKASDAERYCPAWPALNLEAKVDVIATLAVGISRYESQYNPAAIGGKRRKDKWMGLFQLSSIGFARCAGEAGKPLTDPMTNIACAVPAMANLVAEDGRFAGANRGIARWWTVLRDGPRHYLENIRQRTLGLPVCRV